MADAQGLWGVNCLRESSSSQFWDIGQADDVSSFWFLSSFRGKLFMAGQAPETSVVDALLMAVMHMNLTWHN